jgi:hypothetical protein
MTISLRNETIELNKELEIVLIISESACVDNLITKFKSRKVESDVFWLRDPMQLADYVESVGSYRGKTITSNPKFFILDGRFGIESYEFVCNKLKSNDKLNKMPLYVLSKGLSPLEKEIFSYKGINLIDETLMGQLQKNKINFRFYE